MSCASDIPERYSSPTRMAQTLTSYIACPYRVQDIIREHFINHGPDISTIRKMRAKHLEPAPKSVVPVDGRWSEDAESAKLAAVNDRFVAALMRERGRAA